MPKRLNKEKKKPVSNCNCLLDFIGMFFVKSPMIQPLQTFKIGSTNPQFLKDGRQMMTQLPLETPDPPAICLTKPWLVTSENGQILCPKNVSKSSANCDRMTISKSDVSLQRQLRTVIILQDGSTVCQSKPYQSWSYYNPQNYSRVAFDSLNQQKRRLSHNTKVQDQLGKINFARG